MDPLVLLSRLRIDQFCQSARFQELDLAWAYLRGKQYAARRYDWDANLIGYRGDVPLPTQHYVPIASRRPSVRRDLAKLIVKKLTAMGFGLEQWPTLTIPGDPQAEDFVQGLVEATHYPVKLIEARWKGGASGTVAMSFGFVNGVPRVVVHEAKHCKVLQWADRDELIASAAVKIYRYSAQVVEDGRLVERPFYFVRYWDTEQEVVWDPIPDRLARENAWMTKVTAYKVAHGYGECPFYWIQNLPDSENEDGLSDFDGMMDRFDALNYLASSTTRGTIANVDPTLVIKDEQTSNRGVIRKGSENAIYSKGGAEYLELKGDAVKAAKDWADQIENWCLSEAGVVNVDPQTIAAKAQSGEALKTIFMPMAAQCDLLRAQYGKAAIVRPLQGMLRAARRIINAKPGEILTTEDGRLLQQVPTVTLPPKVETKNGADGAEVTTRSQRVPGISDDIRLNWRAYFPPTPTDVQAKVVAVTTALGKTIASKTAVAYTAQDFGVKDIEAEAQQIEVEAEAALERMMEYAPAPGGGSSKSDDNEE